MRPAPIARRLGAYILDCVLLFVGLLVLQAALYPVNPIVAMQRDGRLISVTQLHLWVFATATLPFLLYFTLTLASRSQATVAMRWMAIRVERLGGGRISTASALLRSAVLLFPFELNHTVMFQVAPRAGGEADAMIWAGVGLVWLLIAVYVIVMLLSPRRQSVHDLVARTIVVRT